MLLSSTGVVVSTSGSHTKGNPLQQQRVRRQGQFISFLDVKLIAGVKEVPYGDTLKQHQVSAIAYLAKNATALLNLQKASETKT